MRSIFAYTGHPGTVAALKLAPLLFVRPGELRTAEWAEIDLDAAEWRIPDADLLEAQSEPLHRAAAEVLHKDVGAGRELAGTQPAVAGPGHDDRLIGPTDQEAKP